MRMLFAFAGNRGQAEPLVPIARAALAAGHAVTLAGHPSTTSTLAARGFDVATIGTVAESVPQRLQLRDPALPVCAGGALPRPICVGLATEHRTT